MISEVATARARAAEPDVMICDEITSATDHTRTLLATSSTID